MSALPTKLKIDSIQDAIFELRFRSKLIPEVYLGRIAGAFGTPTRLPTADIPLPIRRSNPTLAFQPILQTTSANGNRIIRVGEQVFNWTASSPYPGWSVIKPELIHTAKLVGEAINDIDIIRVGLRYTNLLNEQAHGIKSIDDLNLSIDLSGSRLKAPLNLNYLEQKPHLTNLVRIATPEFVQGPNANFTILVDLDAYAESPNQIPTVDKLVDWIEDAHTTVKTAYFQILKPDTISALKEA